MLEGARHQFTRELLTALVLSNWSLENELVQKMLLDSFSCPVTTKSYTEDVFRDMRQTLKGVPVSKVSPWTRQEAAQRSLEARDETKILQTLPARDESIQQFARLKNKKLLTAAVFSPLTNSAKAKRANLGLIMF